ncbi:MAG: HEAT repeat domain-containing protein [Moorellales bacterium]
MADLDDLRQALFDPEERERLLAALELRDFPAPEIVELLAQRLAEEPSRVVQEAIVSTLTSVGSREVVRACAGLLDHPDAYVRNAALEILQALDHLSLPVARELIGQPDRDLRLFGVRLLGEMKRREAVDLLRRVVESDGDVNVVAEAIEYLGEMGQRREDREAIMRAAERLAHPYVRFAAEMALMKMGADPGGQK